MQSGVVKNNEYVVNYLQYKKKGAGGDYKEVVCAHKKGDAANSKVYSYKGSTSLGKGSSALTGKKLTEAPNGHSVTTDHRKGFGTDSFKTKQVGSAE